MEVSPEMAPALTTKQPTLCASLAKPVLPENPLEALPQYGLRATLSYTGAFGLRLLYWDSSARAPLALKCFERAERVKQFVEAEVLTHRRLRHPNLLEFKEVLLSKDHICVLTEHASGGDLSRYIQKAGRLHENVARWFFQSYVLGLDYCHRKDVYNINPDCNLLQKLPGLPLPLLKLSDFGYSRSLYTEGRQRLAHVGTLAYMAPETLLGGQYDRRQADVWSCGVLLYLMLFGRFPFDSQPQPTSSASSAPAAATAAAAPPAAAAAKAGQGSERDGSQGGKGADGVPSDSGGQQQQQQQPTKSEPRHLRLQSMLGRIVKLQWSVLPDGAVAAVSPPCRDLLGRLLKADPSERPTVAAVLQHPWFLEGLPASALTLNDQFLASEERAGLQSAEEVQALLRTPHTPQPQPQVPRDVTKFDSMIDSFISKETGDCDCSPD